MNRPIEPWRTLEWWHIAGLAIVTPLDISRIGLIDPNGPDLVKWLLRLPFWYLPLAVLLARSPRLPALLGRPPVSWLTLWAIVGSFSALWALLPDQALLTGVAILGICLLAAWYVSAAGWRAFATALVAGLTAFLVAGIIIDAANGELVGQRMQGLTSGPTTLGRLAALTIVVAAGLWNDRSLRPLLLGAIVVATPVLVGSGTRTAYLAALLGLAYGLLPRLTPASRVRLLSGLVVVAVVGMIAVSQIEGAASFGARGDPTSVAGRTSIWPVAVEMFRQRPLLGYGAGSAEALYRMAAAQGRLTFLAGTSHSIFLSPLVLGGVVGFSLLVTAAGSTIRHRKRVDPWVIAPLVTITTTGLTESIIHIPSVGLIVIAGCLAAVATASPTPSISVPTGADRRDPRPLAHGVGRGVGHGGAER